MSYLTQRFLQKPILRSQFLNLVLISLVLIALQATPASAQWVTNSGSTTTNDKVGIGTATPNYKLDVTAANAQIRFGSSAVDSGGYLLSTGANQADIAGGAVWNGSSWVAKATAATIIDQNLGI